MTIAIDFDGTCVTHDYPALGNEIGAIPVLRKLVDNGHNLILFTMRSGLELNAAVKWFDDNGITLFGVQYNPTQFDWTESNKCYAQLYIDDAGIGCPLVYGIHNRPFVDWQEIDKLLTQKGMFK